MSLSSESRLSGALHPTILLALWAILGFGLSRAIPSSVLDRPWTSPVGVALLVVGGLLLAAAELEFRRRGATSRHDRPTAVLVTTGVFRWSRHPVYLGLVLMMTGVSLFYASTWSLLLVLPFVVVLQRATVRPEEIYLERLFGADYRAYRRDVRQWI